MEALEPDDTVTILDGMAVATTFFPPSSEIAETIYATDPFYQFYTTIVDASPDLNGSTPLSSPSYHEDYSYFIPLTERIIETIILSTIWVLAFWGNILLWMVVFKRKSLKTITNAMVLCLSAADLLVSVVNLPFTIFTVARGEWIFGNTLCVILGFMNMLTFVASVMSLAAIGICRYIFIVHPDKFRRWYTRKNTGLKIAGVWLFSGLLACPPLLGWGIYDYLPQQSFCFCDWTTSVSYTFFMVGVCFGGPCSVMTFCYVQILRVVRKSRQRVDNSMKRNSTSSRMPIPPVTLKVNPTETTKNTTKNDSHENRKSFTPSVASSTFASGSSGQTDCTTVSSQVTNMAKESTVVANNLQVPSKQNSRNSKSFEQANGRKSNENDNHSRNSHHQEGLSDTTPRQISNEAPSNTSSAGSELGGAANLGINSKDNRETYAKKGQSSAIEEDRHSFLNRLSYHGGSIMKSMVATRTIKRRATENDRTRRRRQEELKLTKSFVVVIFCFIICWMPFCVAMFWNVFGKNPPPRIFDMSTLILGYFNSCCNPIIYGVMNNKFRAGYKAILCNPCCSKNKGVISLNSSLTAAGDQGSIVNQTYSQNAHGSHNQ